MTLYSHDANTEVQQLARAAAHYSWAKTKDRTARTANGRAALLQRFLDEADGDPVRAESLRKAYYARLTAASLKARRAKREAREKGAA